MAGNLCITLTQSSPFSPKLYSSKPLLQKSHRICIAPLTPFLKFQDSAASQASTRGFTTICFSSPRNGPDYKGGGPDWPILRRWDVPWNWQTVSLSSLACGLSIPDLKEPFNLQRGWLLWAGIGLTGAIGAIALTGVAMSAFNGEPAQRETDALARLLPLIGSSSISTASLLGITGVLAPILEETVFRGFFMVSLTKWVPTPLAVVISGAVFALAHLTPGQFPQLFVLGTALGFSYAQTRNLLTPITIHALWNSGVILLLTFLQVLTTEFSFNVSLCVHVGRDRYMSEFLIAILLHLDMFLSETR
uniref:CAAX amino terminal protease family protein, putative n=1 Tax=Solanum demissum TaxID=50514 RepID=Q6L3V4_SOLDE|nr:CAAX amino terminal protease family protein, putative [Solanum demissum]